MRRWWMLLIALLLIAPARGEGVPDLSAWPEEAVAYRQGAWLQINWDDRVAWYSQQPDGQWTLSGLQDHTRDLWYTEEYWGMYEHTNRSFVVGNTAVGLEDGPAGDALFDMLAQPDRGGLAVVCVPRAALYTQSDGRDLRGELFQGTPVKMLAEVDGWVSVALGSESPLTGWVRLSDLARDEEIDLVERPTISLGIAEEIWETITSEPPYVPLGQDGAQVLLLTDGEVLHVPYLHLDVTSPAQAESRCFPNCRNFGPKASPLCPQ